MADRIFFDVQALQPNAKIVAGNFTLASGSDPTSVTGKGYSVARTASGKYTVTLDDKYPGILSATATVASSTVSDSVAQIGDIDVSSAKTVVIHVQRAGSASENAGEVVHFCLVLRNTSIT